MEVISVCSMKSRFCRLRSYLFVVDYKCCFVFSMLVTICLERRRHLEQQDLQKLLSLSISLLPRPNRRREFVVGCLWSLRLGFFWVIKDGEDREKLFTVHVKAREFSNWDGWDCYDSLRCLAD